MKKLIIGLFTALIMGAGLVSFAGTPAATASGHTVARVCPYTSCVKTSTTSTTPNTVKRNKKAKVGVKVKAQGSNAKPVGRVKVTITGPGGYKKTYTASLSGGKASVLTGPFKNKGKYRVTIVYTPKAGSAFKASTTHDTFRVK